MTLSILEKQQAEITLHMKSSLAEIPFDGPFGVAAQRAHGHARSLGWLEPGSAMTVSGGIVDNSKGHTTLIKPTISRKEFEALKKQEDGRSQAICWAIQILGPSIVD